MNKENIEKKKRMLKDFSEKGQGQRVFFEEDLELIRDILQHLEQKEYILDKVTDKLKEKIELIEDVIDLCKTDGKIAKYKIEQLEEEKGDLQEILNIIEGGNNGK